MIIIELFYFFLPVAFANMAPVLFKKYFLCLAKPIDQGKKWCGKEIFGAHKTWRGLIVATVCGGIIYIMQYCLAFYFPDFNNLPFDYFSAPIWLGFLFSFAAIMGDLIKSFIKRQLKIPSGKSWLPFDQIDFLITSCLIMQIFFAAKWYYWVLILGFGIILHILINRLGFWLKLKSTPW